jgi:dTDP-glucose 4,6-dehydratase/UDP-glucose 4-epimerase
VSKLLVTGGLGFIGAALCRALHHAGHSVRVLDNGSRGAVRRFGDAAGAIEVLEGDIRDAERVSESLRGVDGVFHLAYVNGTEFFYQRPGVVLDVGVRGMLNVLDGCVRHGVRELVLLSSSEVYQSAPRIPTDESAPLVVPDPFNPRYSYGGGKIISELLSIHLHREHFERMLIVRPHNVFGADMGFEHVVPQLVMRIARRMEASGGAPTEVALRGSGQQTRAFIHIDDFTRGLMLVRDKGQHLNVYHVGSMEEVRISELALAIADELGARITLRPGPAAAGETERRCPDTAKLKKLGFADPRPVREGLRDVVRWYVDHRHLWPAPSDEGIDAGNPPRKAILSP